MSQEASSSSIPRYPHGWYALHADLAARPEFASLSQAAFIHLVNSEWQNAPPEVRNHYSLQSLSQLGGEEGDESEQQVDESNTSTAVQYPPPSQMDFVNGPFDPLGPSPPMDAYSPTDSSPASSIQLDPSSRDHGPASPPSSDLEDGKLKDTRKWGNDRYGVMAAMSRSSGEPNEVVLPTDTMDVGPTRER